MAAFFEQVYDTYVKRGSMQCKIPEDIREQLADDPFMQNCILAPLDECEGRIEWNHAFTYAGKRVNELWAILPMCTKHHREEARWRFTICGLMNYRIAFFNLIDEVATKYPKSTLL